MEYTVRVMSPLGQRNLTAREGERLYDCLLRGGISLDAPCGGHCFCGKCKVQLEPAGMPQEAEAKLLTEREIMEGYRLACAVRVESDLTLRLDAKEGRARIITEGSARKVEACHRFHWQTVLVPPGTLEAPAGDKERLEALLPGVRVPLSLLARLPEVCRKADGCLTLLLEEDTLRALRPGREPGPLLGLAVDIGTTTLVAYLVDLATGEELAAASRMNPQKLHGDDVISRIGFAARDEASLTALREKVTGALRELVGELCGKTGVSREEIVRAVLVGNTVMMHLYAGISPAHIAHSPFIPAFTEALEQTGAESGLGIAPAARVVLAPNVASYVGADIVASTMAAGVDESDALTLLVDIGTNGEMVLGNRERLLACSTAAGPALEGAHIQCGMGGVEGAIASLRREGEAIAYTTIGGGTPRGLCGSGLVDAVALLLEAEILDETGRLDEDALPEAWEDRMTWEGRNALFALAKGEKPITLSQKDIREVQLAKGAIAAGIEVLAMKWGVPVEKIDCVCLAGGFGNYISKENACRIGLLPPQLLEKIVGIGNGAGAGAKMMLLSRKEEERATALSRRIEYIELSAIREFQDLFMDKMLFE